ncbi:MAG: tetraacyldisaccharide 4'-kinase [Deferribacteres bacterium]|nr:tetraacyldisaccharide 4'-kinase [candidate division KSB1 bacterium]MCB9503047.1 tetraacyldisaccharide 4'-kinase [Deferribacteres bacterium]
MRIFESKIWRFCAWPFSLVFHTASFFRNKFYDWGIFKSYRLNTKIISVGNISVGGTGKTPVIMALAEYLQSNGKTVAVLSRGYARRSRGIVVVSEGNGPVCGVEQAGDEPFLIASLFPQIPVVVAEDRVAGGRKISSRFNSEVILLDDGFQHRKLQRDLEIVLLDSRRFLQNRSLLPAGPYREGAKALKRASAIFLVGQEAHNSRVMKKLRNNVNCHIDTVDISSKRVWLPGSALYESIELLRGKKIFVISGIGQPEKLHTYLQKIGCTIIAFRHFKDHHVYKEYEITKAVAEFHAIGAQILVTTWKDWVKIQSFEALTKIKVCIPEHKAHLDLKFLRSMIV